MSMNTDTTNPARNSDIDRRLVESIDEAEAVLEQYVTSDTLSPRWDMDLGLGALRDQARRTDTNGVNPVKWQTDEQRKLSKLCFDEFVQTHEGWQVIPNKYKLGSIQLWTAPPTMPKFHLEPGCPILIFTTLDTRSHRYVEGVREALVVYYQTDATRVRKDTGYEVMDDRRFDGLIGPLRYFRTVADAQEAMTELLRAIGTLQRHTAGTAEVPDPIRMVGVRDFTADPDVF